MKERPILFQGAMVRALLAGTKTQTRRVIVSHKKAAPHFVVYSGKDGSHPRPVYSGDGRRGHYIDAQGYDVEERMQCPYGHTGDQLWVRETWSPDPPIDDTWASTQWNGCGRVVNEIPDRFHHPRFCNYSANWLHGPIRWTPSIHMPRWASRIQLEVTGVRVEKLQAISSADAIAEGIPAAADSTTIDCDTADPRQEYRALWESINGAGSWDANPWVWVVEFKRTKP